MKTRVVVSLQVEGTHHWDSCNKAEVNYLAHEHRHMFHIKAKKNVSHGDREIEIIKLKHKLEEHFVQYYCQHKKLNRFGAKSCEMLALELCKQFELSYCEVLEDGENGAEVEGDFTLKHDDHMDACSFALFQTAFPMEKKND